MVEDANEAVLQLLRSIDRRLDHMIADIRDLRLRMTSLDERMALLNRRLDRLDERLERVEDRLKDRVF